MQIGCNFSPELMKILEKELDFVDAIKLSKEEYYDKQFEKVGGLKPILFHFIPRIFSDVYLDPEVLERFKQLLSACNIGHVGIHFMPGPDSSEYASWDQEKLIDFLCKRFAMIKEKLGVKILIENMPMYAFEKEFEFMADPDFISKVCNKADIGLLFDCAHGRISASQIGMSDLEYLKRLPLDRIYEVHVSGPRIIEGRFRDVHDYLQEDDYDYLRRVLSASNPSYVTLEYGGEGEDLVGKSDYNRIMSQISCIKEIVKEASKEGSHE
jgi:hypothetical protein